VQHIRNKIYDIVAEQMTVDRNSLTDEKQFYRHLGVN